MQNWFGFHFADDNAWEWDYDRETDENGVEWDVTTHTCAADGVVIKQWYQDTPLEGETCKVGRQETWQLIVDGEVKYEA